MVKWGMPCPHCGASDGTIHRDGCLMTPPPKKSKDDGVDDGYDCLRHVLAMALEQANAGKGKERHANGKPFDRQPIMEIGRMVGSGYPLGQAMKKAQESTRLPPDRAKAELLGAINYLAAAYLLLP